MKKIVLIGGGGHCKSVLDAIKRANEYTKIVITDPQIPFGTSILGCEVVGDDSVLPQLYKDGFEYAFITVGNIKSSTIREKIFNKAVEIGFDFPVIVDPSAIVSAYATLGKGTFVGKKTVINADVNIGSNVIINTGTVVEHDCIIGDFSHISVGSNICGAVKIGKNCFVGAGVTVIQSICIGENVTIGAGSVVIKDVTDNLLRCGLVKE